MPEPKKLFPLRFELRLDKALDDTLARIADSMECSKGEAIRRLIEDEDERTLKKLWSTV